MLLLPLLLPLLLLPLLLPLLLLLLLSALPLPRRTQAEAKECVCVWGGGGGRQQPEHAAGCCCAQPTPLCDLCECDLAAATALQAARCQSCCCCRARKNPHLSRLDAAGQALRVAVAHVVGARQHRAPALRQQDEV
jgi:hypothetical protein